MEQNNEPPKETIANLLDYLERLKNLKPKHEIIKNMLDRSIAILEDSKTHLMQIIMNINHHSGLIKTELAEEEFGIVYSNIDILSTHLPNFQREQKNWNTLKQKEINNLAKCIENLVEASNNIERKIVEVAISGQDKKKDRRRNLSF